MKVVFLDLFWFTYFSKGFFCNFVLCFLGRFEPSFSRFGVFRVLEVSALVSAVTGRIVEVSALVSLEQAFCFEASQIHLFLFVYLQSSMSANNAVRASDVSLSCML